jgi:hypothetical protein
MKTNLPSGESGQKSDSLSDAAALSHKCSAAGAVALASLLVIVEGHQFRVYWLLTLIINN